MGKIKCSNLVHEDIANRAYHKGYYEGVLSLKMTLGEDMFEYAVKLGEKEERERMKTKKLSKHAR